MREFAFTRIACSEALEVPGEAKTDAREAFVIADAARVFAMLRDGTFDEDQPAGTGA
ncbi:MULTISPECIES: hypothetical protein [unclassified Streptomyces]|uniref:hypothetical protein n=1 Tax=unclassified Streptomyces TaxID=2593676 RepID=UPI0033BEE35E